MMVLKLETIKAPQRQDKMNVQQIINSLGAVDRQCPIDNNSISLLLCCFYSYQIFAIIHALYKYEKLNTQFVYKSCRIDREANAQEESIFQTTTKFYDEKVSSLKEYR